MTVVDLDIVNPYFRTADFSALFESLGIRLVCPLYANTNLDIPALSFDLARLAEEDGYLLVDVGGDDAGAVALGRSSDALKTHGDALDLFCVVNARRYLENGVEEALLVLREMEKASRMAHTGIINNTNWGCRPHRRWCSMGWRLAKRWQNEPISRWSLRRRRILRHPLCWTARYGINALCQAALGNGRRNPIEKEGFS